MLDLLYHKLNPIITTIVDSSIFLIFNAILDSSIFLIFNAILERKMLEEDITFTRVLQ